MSDGKDIKVYPLSKSKPDVLVEQPPLGNTPNPERTTRYIAGHYRSRAKLRELRFDPISKLVSQYYKLEGELNYQERWRAGEVVPLTATGKIRQYNQEYHLKIYDQLAKVATELLRYGYGRVPEAVLPTGKAPPKLLIVQHNDDKSFLEAEEEIDTSQTSHTAYDEGDVGDLEGD